MTILQAVILGLVQGLAEFLPISSSGHLALLQHFFGIEESNVLLFTIMLHVGTLVSVFIVYWKEILSLIIELCAVIKDVCTGKGLRVDANQTRRFGFMIIVATIPTMLIGLLFDDLFESLYTNIIWIGIGLLITGTLMFIAERKGSGSKKIKEMRFRDAFFVGVMQGIAIWPGVSRSGSTLVGGLFSDFNREMAVKFAFLISIPTILGSAVLELPEAIEQGIEASVAVPMLVGIIVAAVSGLIAIKAMIKFVTGKRLWYFSVYTWAVGAAVVIYSILAL